MLKTTRAARLNRRRYLEIVKLLKEVIANEKAGLARRMKAADTLIAVYERHDRAQERKQAQRATGAATDPSEPQTETEPVETAEQAATRFLAQMAAKKGNTHE